MFGPWFIVTLLALESSEVIGLRIAKLAGGGRRAARGSSHGERKDRRGRRGYSLRRDLIDFVRRIVALLQSPIGAALLSLMAARTPDLIPGREAFWRRRFEIALVILQRGRAAR
jgi:hypothetical protein